MAERAQNGKAQNEYEQGLMHGREVPARHLARPSSALISAMQTTALRALFSNEDLPEALDDSRKSDCHFSFVRLIGWPRIGNRWCLWRPVHRSIGGLSLRSAQGSSIRNPAGSTMANSLASVAMLPQA